MDAVHFDGLTRSFGATGSRRRALGGLLTGALGPLGWHPADDAAAHDTSKKCKKLKGDKRKTCRKKATKHTATHLIAAPVAGSGDGSSPPPTPHVCQGRNLCAQGPSGNACGWHGSYPCFCQVTTDGQSFCGTPAPSPVSDCTSECTDLGGICVKGEGGPGNPDGCSNNPPRNPALNCSLPCAQPDE
jgi:hypothetical protein